MTTAYKIVYAFGIDSADYPTRIGAIRNILERWEDNEINCTGIMAFLKKNGHDFDGLTDDDLDDEGCKVTKETRLEISDAVRALCSSEGEEMELGFIRELAFIDVCETSPSYAIEYEGDEIGEYTSLIGAIKDILNMWADNDIDAYGTLSFLQAHGHTIVNGLTDDDINEGTDTSLLRAISAAVIKVCEAGGEPVQEEFITALKDIKMIRVY